MPLWVGSAYRRTIHPFRPQKCWAGWTSAKGANISPEVVSILDRPFYYFAKGGQSYVFASLEGEYVLKLFHFDACRIKRGKPVKALEKWEIEAEACRVAEKLARKETGMIYAHLGPVDGVPMLQVVDFIGRTHRIDPTKVRFVLQRRGESFASAYKREGMAFIESVRSLLRELGERGIVNRDPRLEGNFGSLDGKAFVIDFGHFAFCPSEARVTAGQFEEKLDRWLVRH